MKFLILSFKVTILFSSEPLLLSAATPRDTDTIAATPSLLAFGRLFVGFLWKLQRFQGLSPRTESWLEIEC